MLGSGPFGRQVAGMLERCHPGVELRSGEGTYTDEDPCAAFDGTVDAVVIALWRPAPALCEEADRLAHETGTPWLPVVDGYPYLVIGPWVVPGAGPCLRCHVPRHGEDLAEPPHGHGPAGPVPYGARIAGGIVLSRLQRPDRAAGRVIRVSLRDLSVSCDTVVPRPDCDRCGGGPGTTGLRAVPRPATAAERAGSDDGR